MKKLIVTALSIGLAAALQPAAHAQFGSGIVYDPTQSVHAITQIEHEEQSISNQFQQIEQGQQIFTNTVKIATTASLQRRQAAVQPRAPDDPRAQNALFAISVSDFRLATATADIEHLWEFDGMAQFGEYGKGSHSLLPASERADYHQRNPWLQHCQCCWAVADCCARREC